MEISTNGTQTSKDAGPVRKPHHWLTGHVNLRALVLERRLNAGEAKSASGGENAPMVSTYLYHESLTPPPRSLHLTRLPLQIQCWTVVSTTGSGLDPVRILVQQPLESDASGPNKLLRETLTSPVSNILLCVLQI